MTERNLQMKRKALLLYFIVLLLFLFMMACKKKNQADKSSSLIPGIFSAAESENEDGDDGIVLTPGKPVNITF